MDDIRSRTQELAQESRQRGDPIGWFEVVYADAAGDPAAVPWAKLTPNPHLLVWLERTKLTGTGKRALVVGCGLGDDAAELARLGFDVLAFDISQTAITWARSRFPDLPVQFQVADLFNAPPGWDRAFDFVLEAYTVQPLPLELREAALRSISRFVAPGGTLLLISRGREPDEDLDSIPLPLTRADTRVLTEAGLTEVNFEDYLDDGDPPARRFRGEYRRG